MASCQRINIVQAFGFAGLFIDDDVAHDGVSDQRHSSGSCGSRKRRRRTAVIRLGCTSTITMAAPVTGGPCVRSALMNGLGEYGAPTYDDPAVRIAELIN